MATGWRGVACTRMMPVNNNNTTTHWATVGPLLVARCSHGGRLFVAGALVGAWLAPMPASAPASPPCMAKLLLAWLSMSSDGPLGSAGFATACWSAAACCCAANTLMGVLRVLAAACTCRRWMVWVMGAI